MPAAKMVKHALQCAAEARAAAARSSDARERATSAASRAAEIRVLTDELLARAEGLPIQPDRK